VVVILVCFVVTGKYIIKPISCFVKDPNVNKSMFTSPMTTQFIFRCGYIHNVNYYPRKYMNVGLWISIWPVNQFYGCIFFPFELKLSINIDTNIYGVKTLMSSGLKTRISLIKTLHRHVINWWYPGKDKCVSSVPLNISLIPKISKQIDSPCKSHIKFRKETQLVGNPWHFRREYDEIYTKINFRFLVITSSVTIFKWTALTIRIFI